jgi:hypothetical protein
MNHLDSSLKDFIQTELSQICESVDVDHTMNIPRREELFIQKFLKDPKGKLIENEKCHNLMHQFRRKAHRHGFKRLAIFGAFGLGKTENMCIGLTLTEIAKNPAIQIKIVHVSENEAQNRVRAIKEYIENDEDYKRLAPHIKPTPIWGQQKLIVKCKTISKDPTVQGFPVITGVLGGRSHLIIFDDPQDLKSAVLEPSTRENIELMIRTTWLTRLHQPESESEVIVLMNRWHENDLVNYIQNTSVWSWMSIEVAETKDHLIYRDSFGKTQNIPLWTKYPKQSYINKHIEMGDRDYKRGFELKPYSDSDKTFPSFDICCKYGINPVTLLGDFKDWIFVGGIDFAGDKRPGTILTIVAANKVSGFKIPVYWNALVKVTELSDIMVDTWRKFGVDLFMAENNATQGAIIDLLETQLGADKFAKLGIKIEGFFTGRSKSDPLTGLPSLEKEFEKQEWAFCFPRQYTPVDNDPRDLNYRLYQEFKHHPFYVNTDMVMSCWFCREGIKKYFMREQGQYLY